MKKVAVILGSAGQDGTYLTELLEMQDYDVFGVTLNSEFSNLSDISMAIKLIRHTCPAEIYNLAGQTNSKNSYETPLYTASANIQSALNVIEAIKLINPYIRFFQASSSEMFGDCTDDDGYQRETTAMCPINPYGHSKAYVHNVITHYRRQHGLYLVSGILFNHESPLRPENFVTQKITKYAIETKKSKHAKLVLGNVNAGRDWGHAKDTVDAMWLMMQQPCSADYVCATGTTHTVNDILTYCFEQQDLDWKDYVDCDESLVRHQDLINVRADNSKLKSIGWQPKYSFHAMLDDLMKHWEKLL